MDLCLKGSQINLAARQKSKPKYNSQLNLNHISSSGHYDVRSRPSRPNSANFFQKRSRSSLFLGSRRRPQSADPQFMSDCLSHCSPCSTSCTSEHLESISSTNLLQLLLNEAIPKRSTLPTKSDLTVSSVDLSGPGPLKTVAAVSKRQRKESSGSGGGEWGPPDATSTPKVIDKKNTAASTSAVSMSMSAMSLSSINATSSSSATLAVKAIKPDLPGRVSFSKPSATATAGMQNDNNDNDSSEGEGFASASTFISGGGKMMNNDEPIHRKLSDDIKFSSKMQAEATAAASVFASASASTASLKKCVHFGVPPDGPEADALRVTTYEYPKCPSENCSCSTRSSSTASLPDNLEVEAKSPCACGSSTCRCRYASLKTETDGADADATALSGRSNNGGGEDDSPVISAYKKTVGEQLENSVVRNILDEDGGEMKSVANYRALNNSSGDMAGYLNKYGSSSAKSNGLLDKQNNLAEGSQFKAKAKKNFLSSSRASNDLSKADNVYGSSSDAVINNYLKVVHTSPIATKKKENHRATASNGNKSSANPKISTAPTSRITLSSTKSKNPSSGGSRSTSSSSSAMDNANANANAKLKKATSFENLRQHSTLNEFDLDKVDSWMSTHGKAMVKHSSIEGDFEKMTNAALEAILDGEMDDFQGESHSQSSSKATESSDEDGSTYNELVSVIKEIEEDKRRDNTSERIDMNMDLKLNTPSTDRVDSELNMTRNEQPKSGPDPADKYKDILSYLDDVEDSCDKTLLETRRSMPDTNRTEVEFVVEPDISEDVPKLADLLMLPNHQLARRVVALSLRANELANAVYLSKENLSKLRAERQKLVRAEKTNASQKLRDQKKHFEGVVQRHQTFIEQLLKDKGSLCEKVAALTRRLESQNHAWEHRLETEVTKVKETTMAGEKIRRERWVRENTKKIKELTVKGLENEINKMANNHQREITELKRSHQQELLDALEEVRLKHEQIETSIRETCAQDREAIIEKERSAIRERCERQMEEERRLFLEQKQKLQEDLNAERERNQAAMKAKEVEYQARRQELLREKEADMEQAVGELREKMSKMEEKYQNRINTIEKQFEADFEIWKREYENSCKMQQVERENTIRQHYRAERDRQIDEIVSRMDMEALKNAEEYEAKTTKMREKYEKDLQVAESVEKSLQEKYNATREKLAESDAQVRNFQAEIKQLQIELDHSKKMCDDLLAERDQMRENARNEIQAELNKLKSDRDQEIQRIHKRVQQAIEKKDATVEILQKETGTLRERCLKLEAVIRQQRKDYCVK